MKAIYNLRPAILLAGAIALLAFVFLFKQSQPVLGSVGLGADYHATTTQSAVGAFPNESLIQSGNGTLGSVTITGATTGTIDIYDATTSNVSARTNQPATTTIRLASFPASATAGTYTFDRVFFNGLYVVVSGTVPTSTITFR